MRYFFELLPIIAIVVNGQKFCPSFMNHDNKAKIYSADNRQVFVFIANSYWILRERDSKLWFSENETEADDAFEVSSSRMDTIFQSDIFEEDINYFLNSFVFYDNKRPAMDRPFGYFMLNEENKLEVQCVDGVLKGYQEPCGTIEIQVPLTVDDLRKAISFAVKNRNTSVTEFSVFLIPGRLVFAKVETYWSDTKNETQISIDNYDPNKEDWIKYRRLLNIDEMRPIALFLSIISDRLYVFFGFDKGIKYCVIDDCLRNVFEVLIDCSTKEPQNVPPSSSVVLYIIVCFALLLLVIAFIIFVAIILLNRQKPTQKRKVTPSLETVETIDSTTGNPIEHPTLRSSQTNVTEDRNSTDVQLIS